MKNRSVPFLVPEYQFQLLPSFHILDTFHSSQAQHHVIDAHGAGRPIQVGLASCHGIVIVRWLAVFVKPADQVAVRAELASSQTCRVRAQARVRAARFAFCFFRAATWSPLAVLGTEALAERTFGPWGRTTVKYSLFIVVLLRVRVHVFIQGLF